MTFHEHVDAIYKLFNEHYRPVTKREAELMACQFYFARENPIFKKEWHELQECRPNRKEFNSRKNEFCKRWHVLIKGAAPFFVPPTAVSVCEASRFPGPTIKVSIDLRFSKEKILNQFSELIDKWKLLTKEDIGYLWEDHGEHWRELPLVFGNVRSDATDYVDYVNVLRLKDEEKLSWTNIASSLKISIYTARNRYQAALKYVKTGIPGFYPFPGE